MRWLGVINLTGENLQIASAKHKSVRWAERRPSWCVLCDLQIFSGKVYHPDPPLAQSPFLFPIVFGNRKRGSASYIVREVREVRERERHTESERERERQRRKWRHHCRAKIGDEFTLSLAKNSHLAMSLHFPLPKICTFRFFHTSRLTVLKWSPLWLWNSQWVLTFRCQKNLPSLFRISQVTRLFFPSQKNEKNRKKNESN